MIEYCEKHSDRQIVMHDQDRTGPNLGQSWKFIELIIYNILTTQVKFQTVNENFLGIKSDQH